MNLSKTFLFFVFGIFFFPFLSVNAHVGYVLSEEEVNSLKGTDVSFLLQILEDPLNYIVIGATLVFLFITYIVLTRVTPVRRFEKHIEARAEKYDLFVSWILRLALGIALVGAGVSHAFISPAISAEGGILFIQIFIGFLLLIGLFLTPAMLFAGILFLLALGESSYIIGNLDFFAMALSFLILANPKPGIDDLLGIPQVSFLKYLKKYVPFIMRIGLGGAMAYLAIYEKLLNPHLSEQVVLQYKLAEIIPVSPAMWVFSAGVIELFLAMIIIIGLKIRFVSILALFVLSMSFFYFKEDVYSHVTLFSALAVLFITDSGRISVDHYLQSKKRKFNLWK